MVIDSYMESGEPVGSKTLSEKLGFSLSSASIRNIMHELEALGLLYAPHTSAGRMPTQQGLRIYVDGLMEIGSLSKEERERIELECQTAGYSPKDLYDKASNIMSGLSQCAGLVIAPKAEMPVKAIQFVRLESSRILVVLVMKDGLVENRIMECPPTITESELVQAANYINEMVRDQTLPQALVRIKRDMESKKAELDRITFSLVEKGLAVAPLEKESSYIVIRGHSRLLEDVKAIEDLEKARTLMSLLEEQKVAAELLNTAGSAEGVQIFIGSENAMFSSSEWSVILSPYRLNNEIVGAIGVIGPMRINYGRIIPIVDHTSKVMQKLLDRL